ncbi:sigma-70 family RNA polymerase sigma factor [Rhizobium sp. FY34]|uniref:RNA polymerase sigma factor n=1 Tax=Rhizobium sp. FY34 TaxID=2562309 RepID=UPI0010BFF7A0|nr:sigma-70 family RNA polymerase sigma factor [Rhizobium sp. FY34]
MKDRTRPDATAAADIDRSLIRAIAAGRQQALADLVARHGLGLTAFARRYLGGSREEAEDIVQEVFLTVWRKADRFDPERGQVTTWLYRITVNRCIDLRRKNALLRLIGLDSAAAEPVADVPDAETEIAARSELVQAKAGICKLPQRQRMALLLRAVADLDIPAIAEVMGTSSGSVEQLLVRARRSLRDHMAQQGKGPKR